MVVVVQQGTPEPQLSSLNSILAEIREELVESSAQIWSNAELSDYINDGLRIINDATQWKEVLTNLPLAALATNPTEEPTEEVKRIRRVTWDGTFLPNITERELDRYEDNWREHAVDHPIRWYYLNGQPTADSLRVFPGVSTTNATDDYSFNQDEGKVGRVVEDSVAWTFNQNEGIAVAIVDTADQQFYFSSDRGKIGDTHDDGKALGIWYIAEPSELLNDDDVMDLPSWLHPIITYYALFRAYDREGAFRDDQLAVAYLNEFIDWLKVIVRIRNRQFPDRYFSLDAIQSGSTFANRLSRLEGMQVSVTGLPRPI